MKQHSKLRQQEEQAHEQQEQSQTNEESTELSSIEEMLRFDAAQHPPPDSLARRLNETIAREPRPSPTWRQRLNCFFQKRNSHCK